MSCTRLVRREGPVSRGRGSHRPPSPRATRYKAIISGVLRREPAIDFLTAHAAGLRKMKDLEVLALAAEQRRVLVSHDVGTMPAHFREFRDAGKHSTGVFLIAQSLDIGTAIEELLLIWLASEASDWENQLEWMPL